MGRLARAGHAEEFARRGLVEVREGDLSGPMLVAGSRLYAIGTQDGDFPGRGWHLQGRMDGVWAHPLRLLRGAWWVVGREGETPATLRAWRFTLTPVLAEFAAFPGERELDAGWAWFVPDDMAVLVGELSLRSRAPAPRTLQVGIRVAADLARAWPEAPPASRPVGRREGVLLGFHHPLGWAGVLGAPGEGVRAPDRVVESADGDEATLLWEVTLLPGEEQVLRVALGGGSRPEPEILRQGVSQAEELLRRKAERLLDTVDRPRLVLPDEGLVRADRWLRVHDDWLIRHVPGLGRGLGAGLPEYPWFFGCDSGYALPGVLVTGRGDVAKDTLRLLRRVSQGGRVVHEVSTTGQVAHPGNTQETPHFVLTVWETYRWTQDREFLAEMYPACRAGVSDWLYGEQDPDKDLLPSGYGIMEVEGLNGETVDAAAYGAAAAQALAGMARVLGRGEEEARAWEDLASRAAQAVQDRLWLPEGLYADMTATVQAWRERHVPGILAQGERDRWPAEALAQVRAEGEQLAHSPPGEEVALSILGNWVTLVPLVTGLAPRERALKVLTRLESPQFTGEYGLFLDRLTRSRVMTISTAVMAEAEARYDRPEEAVDYLRRLLATQGRELPGSFSEFSPVGGCFVQAWTGAIRTTVYGELLGVTPRPEEGVLWLRPLLPRGWDEAEVRGLKVGEAIYHLRYRRGREGLEAEVEVEGQGLPVRLEPRGHDAGTPGALRVTQR